MRKLACGKRRMGAQHQQGCQAPQTSESRDPIRPPLKCAASAGQWLVMSARDPAVGREITAPQGAGVADRYG